MNVSSAILLILLILPLITLCSGTSNKSSKPADNKVSPVCLEVFGKLNEKWLGNTSSSIALLYGGLTTSLNEAFLFFNNFQKVDCQTNSVKLRRDWIFEIIFFLWTHDLFSWGFHLNIYFFCFSSAIYIFNF